MSYKRYTHNLIIKNLNEVLKNVVINKRNCITSIQSLDNIDHDTTYPKQIIIPGLVNLHCHLVYTGIKTQSKSLFPWIAELVKIQQMEEASLPSPNSLGAALNRAVAGAKQAQSYGTSYLIENSNQPLESFKAMKAAGLKGLIGVEVFGSDPEQAQTIFSNTLAVMNSLPKDPQIRFTLSPHASYDVSPALWRLCQNWCDEHQLPLLTHVAESIAEEEWFKDSQAPQAKSAREFWASINTLEVKLKHWKPYPSSIQYLHANKMLSSNMLITHAVHASREDLEILRSYGAKLISCPRSNIYLENGLPDYDLWQELGMSWALGTDSEASNYNLDLRAEVNAIPGLSAKQRFELITNQAATILGRKDLGVINEGINSDYVVLDVLRDDIDLDTCDPFELVMNTELTRVKGI
jgi:5-methylthioadenosine/S-adenosylhomocysteine deaminase